MSVSSTLRELAAILLAEAEITDDDADLGPGDPDMARRPSRVLADPAEYVNLGDFPAGILSLAPLTDHNWREEALGLARHDYAVQLLWLVGARDLTGIPELHQRATRWTLPLARVLYGHLTLGDRVMFVGDGDSGNTLASYQLGPFDWGEGRYFGLKWRIGITEKIRMEMEP
jgi:hypothetical protein